MTRESDAGSSLVAILDELDELVTSARSMPMSASAIINRAQVTELIEAAKEVLPGQISRADRVVADADAVLAEARSQAEDILERAHTRAEELISEQHVVAEAEAKAARIVAEAEVTAERLARDADDYCDRQLAQFEIDLNAVAAQVSAGRARLEERARTRGPGDSGAGTHRAGPGGKEGRE
ncbi:MULTISPECIES: hypothetical protein [unclassified Pseudactinotalea]|uniref:hypothetical protein n=1 Tax=Micrococcales TaxID=85006 RepID=UPI003C7E3B79